MGPKEMLPDCVFILIDRKLELLPDDRKLFFCLVWLSMVP